MKYGSLYRRTEGDSCMVKHTKSNANSDQKRCGVQKHTNHYMIVPMMVLSIQSCVQNMCIYYDKVLLMSFVHTCHFSRSEFIETMLLLCQGSERVNDRLYKKGTTLNISAITHAHTLIHVCMLHTCLPASLGTTTTAFI